MKTRESMNEEEFTALLDTQNKWEKKMVEDGWRRVIILAGPLSGLRWVRENENGHLTVFSPKQISP